MPNSTRKGKAGERELCRLLRENGYGAIRSAQVAGVKNYDDTADVITSLDSYVRFEVKRGYNDVNVWSSQFEEWIEKAIDETSDQKVSVLAWRPDYADWLFFLVRMKPGFRSLLHCRGWQNFEHQLAEYFGFMNRHPIHDCKVEDPSTWRTTDTFS